MTEATAIAGALRGPAGERRRRPSGAGKVRRPLLWASAGVKDPADEDTLYVDGMAAPGTVGAMAGTTPETAAADRGEATGDTVTGDRARAAAGPAAPETPGVPHDEGVTRSEHEGVTGSAAAWQGLPDAVTKSTMSKGVDAE
ncbi:hypothetical protein [Streptomyces sp. NPDC020597]|uniref:hypothetical protein n=1 Tax=unclassified Streptomyces TaxID=2593676 RepID=UPI0037872C92